MALNRKYAEGFIHQLDASQRGEIVFIPTPLDRVTEVFNLMPSRYTLIFGATGSGKTSFTDFTYVLGPWCFLQQNPDLDIYWEMNYFSLERKQMFKHARWVSWMIYRDNVNTLISGDQILGWKNGPLNSQGYKLVRSYDKEMTDLLDHINMYDGKVSVDTVRRRIQDRGLELGTLFKTDNIGVKQDNQIHYLERFEDKGLVEETKLGTKKYIERTWQGKVFRLYEDDHRYFPDHPRSFVYFVIDGINLLGNKDIMDEISVELAKARDIYGFSVVVVSQQNRAQGDIQRMKIHGSDLSPQLEDIFKSSQMGFDADLILGLFDPVRYKSWDKEGKYGGYVVHPMDTLGHTPSMQTLDGVSRFRSLHILKNTFGAEGGKFGMKFLGECGHFQTLPFPGTLDLDVIYEEIRQGI